MMAQQMARPHRGSGGRQTTAPGDHMQFNMGEGKLDTGQKVDKGQNGPEQGASSDSL